MEYHKIIWDCSGVPSLWCRSRRKRYMSRQWPKGESGRTERTGHYLPPHHQPGQPGQMASDPSLAVVRSGLASIEAALRLVWSA